MVVPAAFSSWSRIDNVLAVGAVERTGRLVCEQQPRLASNRASDLRLACFSTTE